MKILYINNEHCNSIEQLKGYFNQELNVGSDIYSDLLDYGRYGDMAEWLREQGEEKLASLVDAIDTKLCDSDYIKKLCELITGEEVDAQIRKPSFNECFEFINLTNDTKDNETKVQVTFKVLLSVNEAYEIAIRGGWGTRAITINPSCIEEGKTTTLDFVFHKRPGKELGQLSLLVDGTELANDFCPNKLGNRESSQEFKVMDVKFNMILVNGGTFTMGSWPDTHQVTLSDYMCGETPVTEELWRAVMEYDNINPSIKKRLWSSVFSEIPRDRIDRKPKNWVNWDDCKVFIEKLNKITNRQFRLLTEAEWEFAARGGVSTKGFEYSGSNDINDVAWYKVNSNNSRHMVKGKKTNELGIYDMLGNVWEWCNDWYSSCRCQENPSYNPQGPNNGKSKILRGGAYDSVYSECEVHSFSNHRRNVREENIGFRIALSVK